MFKTFGTSKEVFVNQDEGMFVALAITLDSNVHTLETESEGGRTYVKAGSVVKEGDTVLGIMAERYDITEGRANARVVVEGYAWASCLTDNAIAAASALPKIVIMPYKAVVFSLKSQEGLKVIIHAEGARYKDDIEVSDITASGLTVTSVKKVGDNDLAITFSAAGTGKITAIDATALAGVTGPTVKGLPVDITVVVGEKRAVTVTAGEHGSASVDKATAAEGEVVTITATPESASYVVDKVKANGVEITYDSGYAFVMPAEAVAVNVTFKAA